MNSFASVVIAERGIEAILSDVRSTPRLRDLVFELTYCQPTDNTAAYLDIDGSSATGRLTLWSDGSFYSEVLRISDESQVYYESGTVLSNNELVAAATTMASVVLAQ
jgi:hypothetical protein